MTDSLVMDELPNPDDDPVVAILLDRTLSDSECRAELRRYFGRTGDTIAIYALQVCPGDWSDDEGS